MKFLQKFSTFSLILTVTQKFRTESTLKPKVKQNSDKSYKQVKTVKVPLKSVRINQYLEKKNGCQLMKTMLNIYLILKSWQGFLKYFYHHFELLGPTWLQSSRSFTGVRGWYSLGESNIESQAGWKKWRWFIRTFLGHILRATSLFSKSLLFRSTWRIPIIY